MTTDVKTPIPRKLDQSMIDALSIYIARGNYAVIACQLCNISEPCFYRWIKQANKDEERGLTEEESIYISLVKSLKRAEAEAEALMVKTARDAAVEKKDGYLAITVNERRHPDRWGRRDRTQVDINETKRITIEQVEVIKDYGQKVIEGEVKEITDGT